MVSTRVGGMGWNFTHHLFHRPVSGLEKEHRPVSFTSAGAQLVASAGPQHRHTNVELV